MQENVKWPAFSLTTDERTSECILPPVTSNAVFLLDSETPRYFPLYETRIATWKTITLVAANEFQRAIQPIMYRQAKYKPEGAPFKKFQNHWYGTITMRI